MIACINAVISGCDGYEDTGVDCGLVSSMVSEAYSHRWIRTRRTVTASLVAWLKSPPRDMLITERAVRPLLRAFDTAQSMPARTPELEPEPAELSTLTPIRVVAFATP